MDGVVDGNTQNLQDTKDETTKEDNIVENETKFDSLDEEFKAKMQSKVDEAINKEKEANDKLLRAYADFENFKKQIEKEKYSAIDYASEKFAKDLLAPIDALQMAIISAKGDFDAIQVVEKLKEGMELTLKAFNTAFEKHDISEVEYDKFDPQLHNAVMKINKEEADTNDIVEVLQKGYKYKDRLLREAMVTVAN
ncbi:MAG: nucleotide exchange factor GrpE [Epsilonproteobacteria bacterium]|nr:MAG: nucleotide exchange factor GrpE [Campylobacterota bacterium]